MAARKSPASRSTLHAELRRVAAAWLFTEERMTLVAEEVQLGPQRSADVLGLRTARRVRPSSRAARLVHPGLLPFERRGHGANAVEIPVPPEFRIIEVKASRADFLAGVRKGQVSNGSGGLGDVADYCYLLCPWGVIQPGEVPAGWGLFWWWEGPVEKVSWCRCDHSGAAHARESSALVPVGSGLVWFAAHGPAAAAHPLVTASRSRDGIRWPGSSARHRLLRLTPARRLSPTRPLTRRLDIMRAAMTESALWRLYGERSSVAAADGPADQSGLWGSDEESEVV